MKFYDDINNIEYEPSTLEIFTTAFLSPFTLAAIVSLYLGEIGFAIVLFCPIIIFLFCCLADRGNK